MLDTQFQQEKREEENMETQTNARAQRLARLSILLGLVSLYVIPIVLFAIAWYDIEWYWSNKEYQFLGVYVLVNLIGVASVITAFLSVRKKPVSSQTKIAVILAVLVILIMIPCNLSAILPNW
jgi:hypothetical protein